MLQIPMNLIFLMNFPLEPNKREKNQQKYFGNWIALSTFVKTIDVNAPSICRCQPY